VIICLFPFSFEDSIAHYPAPPGTKGIIIFLFNPVSPNPMFLVGVQAMYKQNHLQEGEKLNQPVKPLRASPLIADFFLKKS